MRHDLFAAVAIMSFALFTLASARAASAVAVFAANSTGDAVDSFYNNQTVYVSADANITNDSKTVRIYITADSNSWSDGAALSDVSGEYRGIATNSTGHLPFTSIWTRPAVGSYDIVADIDMNGTYNASVEPGRQPEHRRLHCFAEPAALACSFGQPGEPD